MTTFKSSTSLSPARPSMQLKYLTQIGLLLALCLIATWPARAQVSLSQFASTSFKPHTPAAVKAGAATLLGHYNPSGMLRLTLGLQPPHVAEEQQFLEELRTEGKAHYHQFLSAEEWTKRFDPSVEDEQAVVDWATAQGFTVTRRFPNRLLVGVEAPVATIEKALTVTINNYQVGSNSYFSNDRDPQIPSNLTNILHSIGGLNSFDVLHPNNKSVREPAWVDYTPGPAYAAGPSAHTDGDKTQLPQSLKKSQNDGAGANYTTGPAYDPQDMYSVAAYSANALYNLGHCCNPTNNSGGTPPATSIAIASYGLQQASDIAGFHTNYPYLAYDISWVYVNGTPTCCDGEGTMDMEWSTAMSNSFGSYLDTAHVYMYDAPSYSFSNANMIYNTMLTDGYARNFSTSWGCEEMITLDVTGCYDQPDADTADGIFASMVGQGWSLTAATGDQGASAGCDFGLLYGPSSGFYGNPTTAVQFPGSDPYIVGAGGTTHYMYTIGSNPAPSFAGFTAWTGGPDGCDTNDGGSTGGYSAFFPEPTYQSDAGLSLPSRGVPDIALNADWYNTPQNFYFLGALSGNGGTSIVAPETVGFFAQANAYLLWLGYGPIGSVNPFLYEAASGLARSDPYYFASGCNNNDITAAYSLTYYCTPLAPGWSAVTGWGEYNFLQLAWALNWLIVPPDNFPVANFSGPTTNAWFNSDQEVTWTVTSTADGVAGFSQNWDSDPGNPTSEPSPGIPESACFGSACNPYNAFYNGPQYANTTGVPTGSMNGCLDFTGALCAGNVGGVQGMHTVYVRTWGNEGESSVYTYGPLGYDTIPPATEDSLTGTLISGTNYQSAVTNSLTATDPGYPTTGSGVASTVYQVNGGTLTTYSGSFAVSAVGPYSVTYHSTDRAGNVENTKTTSFSITSPTNTSLSSSLNPAGLGVSVVFTAGVSATIAGNTPTGTVTFRDGATTLATQTLSGGIAKYTTTKLALGSHSITATYNGASYFTGSTSSTLTEVILDASTTTVTSSLNPSTYGTSVTLTATITHTASPTPTGTVTFKLGTTDLGTGTVRGGTATFETSTLPVSTDDSLTAVYSGDSNYAGSTSKALKQVVNKANSSTSVVSSLNPSVSGQSVTFTATVTSSTTGTPGGTVKFMNGATLLGSSSLVSGKASFSTKTLATGSHNITAVYNGNADFNTSTSPILVQVVNP